jgi:hypothetical protein
MTGRQYDKSSFKMSRAKSINPFKIYEKKAVATDQIVGFGSQLLP